MRHGTKITPQCKTILQKMVIGQEFTNKVAISDGIGDLRRRVKDLIDHHEIPVQKKTNPGKFKTYYLNDEGKKKGMELLIQLL